MGSTDKAPAQWLAYRGEGLGQKVGTVYITDQFPHYGDCVPPELREGNRWVVCDGEKRPFVADEWPKVPASSSDPATWRTYEDALGAYESGRFAGVGRVFVAEDGLVGVDLDDVVDPMTGQFNEWSASILERLDSYSEISPSGEGVKIWVYGWPHDLERLGVRPQKKAGFECYSWGRYFTVTGQFLVQYPAFPRERSESLAEILREEFPPAPRTPRKKARYRTRGRPLDLEGFLEDAPVEVLRSVSDSGASIKLAIVCPWVEEHTRSPRTGTVVGQYPDGACFFRCSHAHCEGRGFRDFYRKVAPPGGHRRKPKVFSSGKEVLNRGH